MQIQRSASERACGTRTEGPIQEIGHPVRYLLLAGQQHLKIISTYSILIIYTSPVQHDHESVGKKEMNFFLNA